MNSLFQHNLATAVWNLVNPKKNSQSISRNLANANGSSSCPNACQSATSEAVDPVPNSSSGTDRDIDERSQNDPYGSSSSGSKSSDSLPASSAQNLRNFKYSTTSRDFQRSQAGDTPLHRAIREISESSLALIDEAEQSSDLDVTDGDGFTALHIAVVTQQPRVVRKLVLAGANSELVAKITRYTALHLACDENDLDCVKALTEPLNDDEIDWLTSTRRALPAIPGNLEITDGAGHTALHVAAVKDGVDVTRHLIKVGAKLDAFEARFGRTPFHVAIDNDAQTVIDYYIEEHPSCINVRTLQNMTSFEIALHNNNCLARRLLECGADRTIRDPMIFNYSDEAHRPYVDDNAFPEEMHRAGFREIDNAEPFHNCPLEP